MVLSLVCSTSTLIGRQYTSLLGVAFRTSSAANRLRHSHAITTAAVFPAPVGISIS